MTARCWEEPSLSHCLVVLRPDEELRDLESLSLTIKSMFCKREKVSGICAHAEVHNSMDHGTDEACFYFFSKYYGIFCAEITSHGKIYIGIHLCITCG